MPDFRKAIVDEFGDNFDKWATERLESNFLSRLKSWVSKTASDFRMYGTDLNENIAKIAKENKLNQEQIKRIVEEVNVSVFLDKYAKTKGKRERRIEFPLADLEKIAKVLNINVSKLEKKANGGKGTMEKVASYEDNRVDFLTTSVDYMPKLWDDERLAKERRNIISKRVLDKIAAVKEQNYRFTKELLWKIARVGDSLISYARMGEPIQEIFSKIANDAKLDKFTQQPIREYVMEKSAEMKKQYKLPRNVPCELNLVDLSAKKGYLLGEHSLMKEASTVEKTYPDIISNGHFTTYDIMVETAKDFRDQVKKVRQ